MLAYLIDETQRNDGWMDGKMDSSQKLPILKVRLLYIPYTCICMEISKSKEVNRLTLSVSPEIFSSEP